MKSSSRGPSPRSQMPRTLPHCRSRALPPARTNHSFEKLSFHTAPDTRSCAPARCGEDRVIRPLVRSRLRRSRRTSPVQYPYSVPVFNFSAYRHISRVHPAFRVCSVCWRAVVRAAHHQPNGGISLRQGEVMPCRSGSPLVPDGADTTPPGTLRRITYFKRGPQPAEIGINAMCRRKRFCFPAAPTKEKTPIKSLWQMLPAF